MLPYGMTSLQTLKEKRRSQPKQARSIKTVETLLDTSANLLEEVGFSNFTTNLLSERTGISIRAIYRYFPNKHAVVMELALRLTKDWQTEKNEDGQVLLSDPNLDWRLTWTDYLDRFIDGVRETKGGIAIMHAMRSDPTLRILDSEIHEEYARDVAESFMARDPNLSKIHAITLSSLLIKTAVSVIGSTLQATPKEAELMLAMLKDMQLDQIAKWVKK